MSISVASALCAVPSDRYRPFLYRFFPVHTPDVPQESILCLVANGNEDTCAMIFDSCPGANTEAIRLSDHSRLMYNCPILNLDAMCSENVSSQNQVVAIIRGE